LEETGFTTSIAGEARLALNVSPSSATFSSANCGRERDGAAIAGSDETGANLVDDVGATCALELIEESGDVGAAIEPGRVAVGFVDGCNGAGEPLAGVSIIGITVVDGALRS